MTVDTGQQNGEKDAPSGSAPPEHPSGNKAVLVGAWVAAVAAVAAAAVGLWGVGLTNGNAHTEASLERRAEAYAGYLGHLAEFGEFIWAASAWSGDGAPSPQPADLTQFWGTAQQLQADLEASYLRASMATTSSESIQIIDGLRADQQAAFLAFKCGAELQRSGCEPNAAMTHEQLTARLSEWGAKLEKAKRDLVAEARKALN